MALNTIVIRGSRFMISAVRNGPIRIVETKTNRIAAVLQTLSPMSSAQPQPVCGAFQFPVPNDTAKNKTIEEITEYQVVNRASAPTRKARVRSRIPVRQQAAPSA